MKTYNILSNFVQLSIAFLGASPLHSATIYRVDNYVSVAQHPFLEGVQNGSLYFNNFESLPFVFPNVTFPLPLRLSGYSIDGDDGLIDGVGNGTTMRNGSGVETFLFNFSADLNGHFPRYFGFAFPSRVDTNFSPPGFVPTTAAQLRGNYEVLGVKDAFGSVVLANFVFDTATTPVIWEPDDARWGTFFGMYNENGISQVILYNSRYLDHLTYGYAIPEPGSAGLWVLAFVCLLTRRQRASTF